MKLTVLGSGSILSKERNCAAFLLESADAKMLIDFGPGNLRRLQQVGNPLEIFTLLLTHAHPDHSLDLVSLLAYKKHSKIFRQGTEKRQFNLFGPRGIKEFYSHLVKAFPFIERLDFAVKIREMEVSKFELFGFSVKSRPVRHAVPALAYRIECEGKSVVFSGDTCYCEEIVSVSKDADLLVLECSLPNEMQGFEHLTPKECALVAKRAKPKKLLLTHFYPMVESTDIAAEIRKEFKGEVVLARDMLEVEI